MKLILLGGPGAGKGTVKAAIDYSQSKIPGVKNVKQQSIKKGYGNMDVGGIGKVLTGDSSNSMVKKAQDRAINATADTLKGKLAGETTKMINKAGF